MARYTARKVRFHPKRTMLPLHVSHLMRHSLDDQLQQRRLDPTDDDDEEQEQAAATGSGGVSPRGGEVRAGHLRSAKVTVR